MEVPFFFQSLRDVRHPPRTCKCIYSSAADAALPFSGSVTHLLVSQAFCGRMHPSVRKMLRGHLRCARVSCPRLESGGAFFSWRWQELYVVYGCGPAELLGDGVFFSLPESLSCWLCWGYSSFCCWKNPPLDVVELFWPPPRPA